MTITSSIETITPSEARVLLESNTRNRSIAKGNVERLAEAMRSGEWVLNGEAIKIGTDGVLTDGQHRLEACVQSGVAFETLVIRNVPAEAMATMDQGKSRSIANVLSMSGYKNCNLLASITSGIIAAEVGGLKRATTKSRSIPVTAVQVLNRLDRDPGIQSFVQPASTLGSLGMRGSIAGVLWYHFLAIDPDDANYFFARFHDGVNLSSDSPIYALRRALVKLKEQPGTTDSGMIAALTIKAWNKFRLGEPVKLLGFRPGGANPERFPEPV